MKMLNYNLDICQDQSVFFMVFIFSCDLDGIKIQGTGNVTSDYSEIRFNYTADDGSGDIDNVFALYTR